MKQITTCHVVHYDTISVADPIDSLYSRTARKILAFFTSRPCAGCTCLLHVPIDVEIQLQLKKKPIWCMPCASSRFPDSVPQLHLHLPSERHCIKSRVEYN